MKKKKKKKTWIKILLIFVIVHSFIVAILIFNKKRKSALFRNNKNFQKPEWEHVLKRSEVSGKYSYCDANFFLFNVSNSKKEYTRSINFLDHSNICSFESANRVNFDLKFCIHISGWNKKSENEIIKVVKEYKNFEVLKFKFENVFKDTLFEEFYEKKYYLFGKEWNIDLSDLLRIAFLQKLGDGWYFDCDVIFQKSFKYLFDVHKDVVWKCRVPNDVISCFGGIYFYNGSDSILVKAANKMYKYVLEYERVRPYMLNIWGRYGMLIWNILSSNLTKNERKHVLFLEPDEIGGYEYGEGLRTYSLNGKSAYNHLKKVKNVGIFFHIFRNPFSAAMRNMKRNCFLKQFYSTYCPKRGLKALMNHLKRNEINGNTCAKDIDLFELYGL